MRWIVRYRPYVVLAVAALLIGAFPASDDGGSDAGVAAGGADQAGEALPSGEDVSAPTEAAAGGTALGALTARPSTAGATTRTGTGTPSASGGAGARRTDAGIGTEAALSAPDCERASGRIKVSFLWRPPCVVPWPEGADNGGATSPGVTADKIRVVLYNHDLDGNRSAQSADELKAQWETSAEAYQHSFRMWGREVETLVVDTSGADEVAQRADAIRIAGLKPFAVVGPTGNTIMTELAARKIVVVSGGNVPVEMSLQLAPYLWGPAIPPDEVVAYNAGEYAGKRLLDRPARWAGQAEYRVTPRKFALIHPDTWNVKFFEEAFARYGGRLTDRVDYRYGAGSISTYAERSTVIAARLKAKGVTTIIAGTDIFFAPSMTQAATAQQWFPEWMLTGYRGQDLALFARAFDQTQWRNAFGPASTPMLGAQPRPADWFYQWYWGNLDNAPGRFQSYSPTLFNGLHTAGPRLTPETFRDGLFAMRPTGGIATGGLWPQYSYGRWGIFQWDDYNAFDDFSEVYWDPTATGRTQGGAPSTPGGNYRHLDGGRRYLPAQWPADEPRMFDPAGTRVTWEEYVPGDKPPDYPCTGCPSEAG